MKRTIYGRFGLLEEKELPDDYFVGEYRIMSFKSPDLLTVIEGSVQYDSATCLDYVEMFYRGCSLKISSSDYHGLPDEIVCHSILDNKEMTISAFMEIISRYQIQIPTLAHLVKGIFDFAPNFSPEKEIQEDWNQEIQEIQEEENSPPF